MTDDKQPECRFCGQALTETFVDLGMSPPCENFLTKEQLNHVEPFYPLHVRVCTSCFLVERTSQLANKRKKICLDCAV